MRLPFRASAVLWAVLVWPGTPGLLSAETNAAAAARPSTWAQPLSLPGVPNLHRVSPTLYRSAQPTGEGMKELRKLGVKTVVNLRAFHSDRDETAGTGLTGESISFKTWHPEDEDIVRFLKIATDTNAFPVLVHCQHGADRTGTMCAVYRIAVQGWPRSEAIREMTQGGFGFHAVWQNLVEYIEKLDVEGIGRKAGLSAPARPVAGPAP